MKTFLLLAFILLFSSNLNAQNRLFIAGTVTEQGSGEALQGATVYAVSTEDSTITRGTSTDENGRFRLMPMQQGVYDITISYVGYVTEIHQIELSDRPVIGLSIELKQDLLQLGEVRIVGMQERVEVRGDTTAFNADAYRVNPDATAEDLIRRMPGFNVENGQVEAQGERVRRVLVDGNEFFGDDATTTLRSLPAEIIQQIEVFDRESDQAQFTGFSDGNTERTLNIVTRGGLMNGQFGRLQSGFGSEDRYTGGGNFNHFDGNRRVSILGLTNNVNQLNFTGEDLAGVSQAAGGGGRGGMMMGGRGGGGGWGGGGAARDFLIGNQNGTSIVHSAGLNYIDRWGEDIRISGSYFFNTVDNRSESSIERRYLSGLVGNQLYDEESTSLSDNYNHRMNLRMEYNINDRSSLIFTPRFSAQKNTSDNLLDALTATTGGLMLNETFNRSTSDQFAYNLTSSILFRHRFEKQGRTISANIQTDFNNNTGDNFREGRSIFYDDDTSIFEDDQNTDINDGGYTIGTNISYTEPLSERTQLMFSYNPSFNVNRADRNTYLFDQASQNYTLLDTLLTNRFENRVMRQNVSGSYRFRRDNYNMNFNLGYQYTSLNGDQTFPQAVVTKRDYHNLLPSAVFQYQFSRTNNLRLAYNTNTRTPSASQLQDVIDNSNPLQLRTGNPDLDQQYTHTLSARFRAINPQNQRMMFGFLSVSLVNNTIGNTTFVARRDTLLQGGIPVGAGARLTRPENVGNSWNVRGFATRGMPVAFIKSNMNVNAGFTINSTPSRINGQDYQSNTYALNSGLTISSNIGPNVDFRISYSASYNIVDNSVPTGLDDNYYAGRANVRFNVMPWRGLVIESDMNIRHYSGLSDNFNNDVIFWNAGIGYKFLKNRMLEAKFSVIDIFAQNDNVNRTFADDYIEDIRSNVLSRYVMFSLTYTFRNFQTGSMPERRGGGMRFGM